MAQRLSFFLVFQLPAAFQFLRVESTNWILFEGFLQYVPRLWSVSSWSSPPLSNKNDCFTHLTVKRSWQHCIAVLSVRNRLRCVSTAPELRREPETVDYQSKALTSTLPGKLSTVYWTPSQALGPGSHLSSDAIDMLCWWFLTGVKQLYSVPMFLSTIFSVT